MVNTEKTNKTKKKDTKNDTSPVYIGRTETYTFLPGSEMHLVGGGFSTSGAGNSILLNGKKVVTGVRSDDGASMAFTIPNLEPGRYTIEVDTGKAKSKDGALIWITIPGAPVPTVTQITPTTVTQAQDIVITGSGFTPTGNDVVTSFGMVSDLRSPDGIHITIPTYTPFGKVVTFRDERGVRKTAGTDSSGKPVPFRYPMSVHVVNTGGVSNPSTFTLEI